MSGYKLWIFIKTMIILVWIIRCKHWILKEALRGAVFSLFDFFTLHSNSGLVTQRRFHQIYQLNCAARITWRLTRLQNGVQPLHSLSIQEKKIIIIIICQDFSVNISLPFLWQISINSLATSKCISFLAGRQFIVLKENISIYRYPPVEESLTARINLELKSVVFFLQSTTTFFCYLKLSWEQPQLVYFYNLSEKIT